MGQCHVLTDEQLMWIKFSLIEWHTSQKDTNKEQVISIPLLLLYY